MGKCEKSFSAHCMANHEPVQPDLQKSFILSYLRADEQVQVLAGAASELRFARR